MIGCVMVQNLTSTDIKGDQQASVLCSDERTLPWKSSAPDILLRKYGLRCGQHEAMAPKLAQSLEQIVI